MTRSTTSIENNTLAPRRTIVITGGNTGLGYACAAELLNGPLDSNYHVVLACRDRARGQTAAEQLRAGAAPAARVEAMVLDLASLASVRQFASELTSRVTAGTLPPLGGLVCNAGVQAGTVMTTTQDGFESTFGVNHLGHFLLVNLLLPLLTPPARIVVVASNVHDPAKKTPVPVPAWNEVAALARGALGPLAAKDSAFAIGQRRYSTSKLANVYFTYELAHHVPAGVTVNAFDPGLMPGTGLTRNASAFIRFIANHVMPHTMPLLRLAMGPNIHAVAESGVSLARLVSDPALATTTSKYFEGHHEIRSSAESYDQARAADLWQASLLLTGQPAGNPAASRLAAGSVS